MDIVVATNNKGKLKELSEMLTGFNVLSQQEVGANVDVEETGTTYRLYHYDYRGSTTAMTTLGGAVVDTIFYDAYGKQTKWYFG